MTEYLKNILPRLQEFSSSLDKKEAFIDKQWVYFDENEDRHTYIFKRDGRLIMSLNGNAMTGKWEYLPEAKSLHIDRLKDQVLLNQALLFDGLMLLKKDGAKGDPWILVNAQVVPDLDHVSYLNRMLAQKLQLKEFRLSDGKTYYYSEGTNYGAGLGVGCKIYDENMQPLTGDISIGHGPDKTLRITNGQVSGITYIREYETDHGVLTIHQQVLYEITLGDKAYTGHNIADGSYIFSNKAFSLRSVDVRDGGIAALRFRSVFDNMNPLKAFLLSALGLTILAICILPFYFAAQKSDSPTITPVADGAVPVPARPDTVYREFFLETPMKYGTFGMTVSEWNRNIALQTRDGKMHDLKEYASIYQAAVSDGQRHEFTITGVFAHPGIHGDTQVEVFTRNGQRVNEGILIGIQIAGNYMPYADVSTFSALERGDLRFIAGDHLPHDISSRPTADEYTSIDLVLAHMGKDPYTEHEDQLKSVGDYKCVYGNELLYAVYQIEIESRATAVCDVIMKAGSNGYEKRDKLIRLKDAYRNYNYLTQTVYSRKQANLNVNDHISEYERKKLEEADAEKARTERLIDKAVQ
ncbi:hypothetical protein GCM10023093_14880 [Nemorincola caseinilytica]|uniref:Uncharacterized protein n=1 Tax=Nemorincola caseinilytica TaxID=2054315 RepID=A0ABP8NBG9_9BACT